MFSVSDIKEDVYPAVYRRGKELYETGGVLDFAYDIYLEHDLPVAEVRAEERCVGMAMDIDEARRNILPCCVKDCPGRSILEIADCGDFSVFNRNIACGRRCASSIDQSTVLNQIIKHLSFSFV